MILSTAQLERVILAIRASQDAAGVLMIVVNRELVVNRERRAEIVAALSEDIPDLPAILRRMADEIESGGGHRIGNDGSKHPA